MVHTNSRTPPSQLRRSVTVGEKPRTKHRHSVKRATIRHVFQQRHARVHTRRENPLSRTAFQWRSLQVRVAQGTSALA